MSIESRSGAEPAQNDVTFDASGPLWRRLAWFVGLWAASVALLAVVAFLIRSAIL